MEENVIYPRAKRNYYETIQYSDIQDYPIEKVVYINQNNDFNRNSCAPYFSNQINEQLSPKRLYNSISNSTHEKKYSSQLKPKYYRNYKNNLDNVFNNNNYYECNEFRTNNINHNNINHNYNKDISQDIPSPLYLTNQKNNHHDYYSSIKYINNSQLYNGNTTDEGESYINCKRDSNFYSQNPYPCFSVISPEEENFNSNDSNVEQLIIYPENNFINENEKYFDKKTKEGVLKPKNLETYTVKSIEYIHDDNYGYKRITVGDYILGSNKKRMKRNKSCNDINLNDDSNDYEIKNPRSTNKDKKNKKSKSKRISSSCGHCYNIKTIKEKVYNTHNINNEQGKKKSSKIFNISTMTNNKNSYDASIEDEINEEKGGVVYLDSCKNIIKYNENYQFTKNNYKHPKWKIIAAACLIQSWWRGLKILYKKNLDKIIIIQKVYRTHYKNKLLNNNSEKKANIKKTTINSNRKKKENNYGEIKTNEIKKKIDKKIVNKNNNKKFQTKNINKCSKKSNINNYKRYYNAKEKKISYSKKDFSFSSSSSHNIMYNLGILLLKKILENKLLKNYNNIILKINKKINNTNSSNKSINSFHSYNNNNYICSINTNNQVKKSKDLYEKKNNQKKMISTTSKKIEKNIFETYNDFLKPINIFTKQNKKKNYLNLNVIAPNNNFSLTYKGNNNIFRNYFDSNILDIEQVYSFFINDNNIFNNISNISDNQNDNSDLISQIKKISNITNKKNKYAKKRISCKIRLNDKYKNLLNPIRTNIVLVQSFLLKKIFIKIWYKQIITFGNIKNEGKKKEANNESNNKINNKKHILLSNIMIYVLDKIKKEIENRSLIKCVKNINKNKYPNLRYAFQKIKKFAKVRFMVMNEYASIIQNAFRYYIENKKKETINENQENQNKDKDNEKK